MSISEQASEIDPVNVIDNSEVAQEKGKQGAGKQEAVKKDSHAKEESDQIPLATQTAVDSDSKVFHSSVLSNTDTDNDNGSATDWEKSKEAENVKTVKTKEKGEETKKRENSEVPQEKRTKGKQGAGKQGAGNKDSHAKEESDQILLATQTAVDLDSKLFHSSVLSNIDNDSGSATGRDKSKETSSLQTSRPETTDVGCSQVEGREKKRPITDPNYVQKRNNKPKRRFRHSSETGASVQKLTKKSSRVEESSRQSVSMEKEVVGGKKFFELIILSMFQNSDHGTTGFVKPSTFWKILQITLALQNDEVAILQETILPDRSGLIPYMEFAAQAMEIIATLHVNQPPVERHWVELQMHDESLHINYNKQTGEAMDKTQTGNDFLANVIEDLYRQADKDGKGYINWEMFLQLLQSAEMSPYLQEQDLQDMYEYYANFEDERASYSEFVALAKEMILRVYRAKYPSESPWYKISSPEVGEIWFNKFTGETYHGVQTGDREQEIAFISQAYAQVEQTNFELEQYKELNRQLNNQLARTAEEQEMLEAQLYETGHALDQANAEIIEKENEVERMKIIIASKDQQIEVLKQNMSDLESTRLCLLEAEQELQNAREITAKRENSITEIDKNLKALQQKAETVADILKDAHGKIDARDSAIEKLEHQLCTEQKKLKDYEEKIPELEAKLSYNNEYLSTTRHSLKEKTAILLQTRKHLRIAREKNVDMDKEMGKLEKTQEKLRSVDSEIRTLKTFLTAKTVLIEKHKKEMQEEKLLVAKLEEKDQKRVVILADVLERTARQYQQQIGWSVPHRSLSLRSKRPYSAPSIPPKEACVTMDPHRPVVSCFKTVLPSHPDWHRRVRFRELQGGKTTRLPKLPRIIKTRNMKHRTKTFVFPTNHDLKIEQRLRDATLLDHTPSNPHCACKLCRINATVNGQVVQQRSAIHPTGALATTSGLQDYEGQVYVQELALSQQLHIGQRVVVRMKKSEFDLEPTKLTGVLRYVGKIDSEYVDHRLYVGVQLDEAVGDMDGLIKNKRYFICPPKHGKLVRISNVVASLPNKEMFYKSLPDITKRNLYTAAQKKLCSIKVA